MEGLDQLFLQKEYITSVVCIPCFACDKETDHNNGPVQQQQSSIEIELTYSEAASTDLHLTGQILWPVSSKEVF